MDIVEKLFGSTDLYEIIGVEKDKAKDPKALKAAYLRAALRTHPDKGEEGERDERTQKFQAISKIYELMQDEDQRKIYDDTGAWPDKEEFTLDVAPKGQLTEEMVLAFKKHYIGSEEEKDDVIRLYKAGKGDIFHVIENLFFANILDDEERVQKIVDELIEDGTMMKTGKGVNPKVRERKIKKAKKEAEEAEQLLKEKKIGGGMDDLTKALAKNATKRGNFVEDMEKKYLELEKLEKEKKGKKGGKKGTAAGAGGGRGRPKKIELPEAEEDEDEEEEIEDESQENGGGAESDEPEEEADPPAKKAKGRGRPAKKTARTTTAAAKAKGRGRPKKNVVESDDETENGNGKADEDEEEEEEEKAEVAEPVTKGRGRQKKAATPPPKKTVVEPEPSSEPEEDEEEEEEATPPPKKGRGRPPKKAAAAAQNGNGTAAGRKRGRPAAKVDEGVTTAKRTRK